VEEHGLTLDHRVLPRPERPQAETDKVFQPFQGALAGGRDPEIGRFAGVIGEKLGHLGGHFADDGIFVGRGERGDLGFFFGKLPERAAILVVEIPIPALRLTIGGHEDVSFGAESAVVGLHEEVLFPLGPGGEVGPRDEKLRTAVSLYWHVQFF